MKRIILSFCTLLLVSSFNLLQQPSFKLFSESSNLGFSNSKGKDFTQEMYKDAINFINAASAFYKDNVAQNMVYIKQKMDAKYGYGNLKFCVFIQIKARAVYAWDIYLVDQTYAQFSAGVNIINPDWSYLIQLNFAPPQTTFTYLKPWTVGEGINEGLSKLIYSAVYNREPDGECDCSATRAIGGEIYSKSHLPWNTVCDQQGVTEGYVRTVNGYWGTFQPKNCFYTMFVHA